MKYKIFTSDSIEVIHNETLIGEADNFQDACRIIKQQISFAEFNPYWRFILGDIATFVDYGSYSEFVAIVPPVPMEEMS